MKNFFRKSLENLTKNLPDSSPLKAATKLVNSAPEKLAHSKIASDALDTAIKTVSGLSQIVTVAATKKVNEALRRPNSKTESEKVYGLEDLDREDWIYKVFPHVSMELARKYFRLQTEGVENIPRRGPALIAPNHSGFSGFDAFLLSHEVFRSTGRIVRVLIHRFWFLSDRTAVPAEKVGFIKANMRNGMAQLNKNNLVLLFPEGEKGNFKPSHKRYHLQKFRTGLVRLAILRQCPIVPTLVLGAEESQINLAQVKLSNFLGGMLLPIPLNLIPLPTKWKIIFMEPIHLPYKKEAAEDQELLEELAQEIREKMQEALSREVSKRESVF